MARGRAKSNELDESVDAFLDAGSDDVVQAAESYNKQVVKQHNSDSSIPEEDRNYGSVVTGGICPHCTAKQKKEVRLVQRNTAGPIGYYRCKECGYPGEGRTVAIPRPWVPRFKIEQTSVAAREGMD